MSESIVSDCVALFPSDTLFIKDGTAYYKKVIGPVMLTIPVNSNEMANLIRVKSRTELEQTLRKKAIEDVQDELESVAYEAPEFIERLHQRVGLDPNTQTVLIDLGGEHGTLVALRDGEAQLIKEGTDYHHVLFRRPASMQPMVMPDLSRSWRDGLRLLQPYVNTPLDDLMMLVAYITYALAHPKAAGVPYPILVIQAEKGSGKSFISGNVIRGLIDPNANATLRFPRSDKDLAIHSQSAYVVAYDNMRSLSRDKSDLLCSMATGSSFATRALYTDDGLSSMTLHSPLVLNGIHAFIKEPDLADRCLRLSLQKMDDQKRRSERDLKEHWTRDLPVILGSLLKLSALLLQAEPDAEPVHSARIMDFSVWLTAFEQVAGLPAGRLQKAYKDNVKALSASGIEHDSLTIALEKLVKEHCKDKNWIGTPTQLLAQLQQYETANDMPKSPAALTTKLKTFEASFNASGIYFKASRGSERSIEISGQPIA